MVTSKFRTRKHRFKIPCTDNCNTANSIAGDRRKYYFTPASRWGLNICHLNCVTRLSVAKSRFYMTYIQSLPWEYIISGILGLLFIIISSYQSTRTKTLQSSGIRTEGVINELSRTPSDVFTGADIITVRFTTQDGKWITESAKNDFLITYHRQYKLGERVTVIYDQSDPHHFCCRQQAITASTPNANDGHWNNLTNSFSVQSCKARHASLTGFTCCY